MASPLKTGAHVYFEEYGTFAVGDMFQINGLYLFRISGSLHDHREPQREELHYQVFSIIHDFPGEPYGVVVCGGVMNHGYDAKPTEQVLPHVKVGSKS